METCELCGSRKECIPNRGRKVCGDCSWAEMQDNVKHEGFRVIEDGRETVYFADQVTPRAYNYR